jgi:hypothetical protein
MSSEQTINEYLQKMGSSPVAQWTTSQNPQGTTVFSGEAIHMGVRLWLMIEEGGVNEFLAISVPIGFVPKTNVAPLFRMLLAQSTGMSGAYFCLVEASNLLMYRTARNLKGLDFVEFKDLVDVMAQLWWTVANPIIQQFQLPAQP